MSMIEAQNLTFSYNGSNVLENVSFSIPAGNLFTVIGPNGSGKSTLTRLLCGLSRPKSGAVMVDGQDIRNSPRCRLAQQIAVVPQTIPDSFPFTVEQTVIMARSARQNILGLESRADRDAALRAMRYTGIESLKSRPLDRISGGERQRAFIARAVCQETDIMVLDEPTAALDYAHQIQVMDLLARLAKERGTTVVLVSHDLNLASLYADSLLLLAGGKVQACGTPQDVLKPEVLEPAYGCRLSIDLAPETGRPRIIPMPGSRAPYPPTH